MTTTSARIQQRTSGVPRRSLAGLVLRAGTAAALVIDAVVHLQDAHFYDPNTGSWLSQGTLFRVQAGLAIATAVLVLLWRSRSTLALGLLVAGSAVTAVLLYTYVDVGSLAGLPNMYEPSWGPPGKVLSAFAEGTGALLAAGGLLLSFRPGWSGAPARR